MKSKILKIRNVNGKTAYNPTTPFKDEEAIYMGVRVESLDSELDTKTHFAHKLRDDSWEINDSLSPLPLQDPVYMKIDDELYIAGVKVQDTTNGVLWNQEFYRGDSIKNLEHFASGPEGMKDIRLVDLGDRIGVFTRPQGKIGGLGKIGYLEVGNTNELQKLSEADWYNVPLINGLFEDGTWGGVNQALRLHDGTIGVIGHKAYKTESEAVLQKHYSAISFIFNPVTKIVSAFGKIAERKDFPKSPSKRSPELSDIIFPAGIDKKFNLYCGLSDYCIGIKKIKNPF